MATYMDLMQERYQPDPAIIPGVLIGLWYSRALEQAPFEDEFGDDVLDLDPRLDTEAPAPPPELNPLDLLAPEALN